MNACMPGTKGIARERKMWYSGTMRGPDLDRERSERKHSRGEFLALYNEGLPSGFPRATAALLAEYRRTHIDQFKGEHWSLDLHRKKVMDWLPVRLDALKSR